MRKLEDVLVEVNHGVRFAAASSVVDRFALCRGVVASCMRGERDRNGAGNVEIKPCTSGVFLATDEFRCCEGEPEWTQYDFDTLLGPVTRQQ